MSCGMSHRHSSDMALLWLWLWHTPAAVDLTQPLAWEPPTSADAALKKKKEKERKSYG